MGPPPRLQTERPTEQEAAMAPVSTLSTETSLLVPRIENYLSGNLPRSTVIVLSEIFQRPLQ
jgi:hypothetical protein